MSKCKQEFPWVVLYWKAPELIGEKPKVKKDFLESGVDPDIVVNAYKAKGFKALKQRRDLC